MPRKLRVEYPEAIYHVMNRGDRRESIFLGNSDRQLCLETLAQTCQKTNWQVHAYGLMDHHFHRVVETPRANFVAGMQWFLGTYSARFNRRHKLFGHLFSGRYQSLIVDGSGTGYLKAVCDYVHLNPVRARLLHPEQRLAEYRWSSWPEYLKRPGQRRAGLRTDRVLGQWPIGKDHAAGRRPLEQRKELEFSQESSDWKKLRRGWCWEAKGFREEMLELIAEKQGPQHYGEELQKSEEQQAQRLAGEMLREAGWKEEELERPGKGDARKARRAARLRAETTLTGSWLARRLAMGHWRTASHAVRRSDSKTRLSRTKRVISHLCPLFEE